MPNSPSVPKQGTRVETTGQQQLGRRRICDFCTEKTALVYCRADTAKLCLSCDREVHSTNPLFTKHTRWLLCDGCDSSPSHIHCSTHQLVLCQNCDHEVHTKDDDFTSDPVVHDRRPLEGYSGCPSVNEVASFVGIEGFDCKFLGLGLGFGSEKKGDWSDSIWGEEKGSVGLGGDGVDSDGDGLASNFWVWDAPQGVVSIDDLVVPTDDKHGFQALVGLDALPKDRYSSCGRHKQEIIRQLCDLGKPESDLNIELDAWIGRQTENNDYMFAPDPEVCNGGPCDVEPVAELGNETNYYLKEDHDRNATNELFISSAFLGSCAEESCLGSDRDSDFGSSASHAQAVPRSSADTAPISLKIQTPEFSSVNRDSALSRYKQKKRNRRYEKHIRYESRKVLAQGRTRIKGRFAKIDNHLGNRA